MGNFEYSKSIVIKECVIGTKVFVEDSIELLNEKIDRLYKSYESLNKKIDSLYKSFKGIEHSNVYITIEPKSDLYMLDGKYCMTFLIKKIVESWLCIVILKK